MLSLSPPEVVVVNAPNVKGQTPLHFAAKTNAIDVTMQLLSHAADPQSRDENGDTPLDVAVEYNAKDVANAIAKSNRPCFNKL